MREREKIFMDMYTCIYICVCRNVGIGSVMCEEVRVWL